MTQLAVAVEYTRCFSIKGYDFPNECLGYGTK